MSLVRDWAEHVMSDNGIKELQELIDEMDAEAIAYALNPDGLAALLVASRMDAANTFVAIFTAGVHWARYRAEHEKAENVERMLKKVKGL